MPRYSAKLFDHFESPRHYGRLEDADFVGVAGTPGNGMFLRIFLKVDKAQITAVRYETFGCGVTIASGSALAELIADKDVSECRKLTVRDVIRALDGVPSDKEHCPALAIEALQHALQSIDRS